MRKLPKLDRRSFLRGVGTAIALPGLEAMLPISAAHAASAIPKRLMLVYRPMGNYQPSGTLPTDAYAKVQTADVKNLVNIVSRIHNRVGFDLENLVVSGTDIGQGEHGAGISALFSGQVPAYNASTIVSQKVWQMKPTFDQVIGTQFGLKSIAANVSTATTIHPRWLNRYINTVGWTGADASLNAYTNPKEIFNLLFSGTSTTGPTTAEQLRLAKRKSILDLVTGDINVLNALLGASDKIILDQYLTSIREVERKIDSLMTNPGGALTCDTTGVDARNITSQVQSEYPLRLGILQDLAVKAFQCNKAQIFNMLLSGDGDGVNFAAFVPGISGDGGWHSLSHYEEDAANPAKFKTALQWQYDQFRQLLLKLNAVKEADGTSLLYNSAVLMMSSISDGQTHNFNDLHCVIGGNLGGALKTGQVIELASGNNNPPAANVFLTIMRAFGMANASFGNSTGVVSQLLA